MEEWWRGKCNNFQIIYFLFTYGLFNDAISSSDYKVLNEKSFLNVELLGTWKDALVRNLLGFAWRD